MPGSQAIQPGVNNPATAAKSESDTHLQRLINATAAGDPAALETLIEAASRRLLALTRKMFHTYPDLRRWEETSDVFQMASLRFTQALRASEVRSVKHFFNLAAQKIRQTLLDLKKHYYGPEGVGENHKTDGPCSDHRGGRLQNTAAEPDDLESWSAFHEAVERLPEESKEAFNLIYYEGLGQAEAAEVLGVCSKTVQRRWVEARLALKKVLRDGPT